MNKNLKISLFIFLILGMSFFIIHDSYVRYNYEKEIFDYTRITKGIIITVNKKKHKRSFHKPEFRVIKYKYKVDNRLFFNEVDVGVISNKDVQELLKNKDCIIMFSTKSPKKNIIFYNEKLNNNGSFFDFKRHYYNLPFLK